MHVGHLTGRDVDAHAGAAEGEALLVLALIELAVDLEPRHGRRRADQFDDGRVGIERLAAPVLRDEGEQAMLDLVGLRGFEDRKIDELSGGERQRVALARSLAPGPQLLLLDEPLGSLDRTLRDRLAGEIRTILKSLGVTAVFVTHDQAEAFSVADKVAILHHGILQQFATPENLYRAPENSTVARFLGFRNLIEGYLDGNDLFHSPLGKLPIIHPAETMQKKVKLLIRPEGATLDTQTNNRVHLSGIVNDCRFQGSSYKLTLTVNGIELIFDLPIDPVPPQVGQQIDLNLCSSALVLIND